MKIHYLTSSQKKKILLQLNEQFGIKKLPYLLLETGKNKIRGYSGHLSKEEISFLNNTLNLELIGIYLIRKEYDLRISLDGTHLLNNQFSKNIVNLNDSQTKEYIKGNNLNITKPRGTYLITNNKLIFGCAKSNSTILLNHFPKDRRINIKK